MDTAALSTFLAYLPKGAAVLDAGCGEGRELAWFLAQGCRAEGVDASAEMARLAAERTGAPVAQRDLRLLSPRRESFDAIWCARPLPRLTIDECQRVLQSFFQALKPRTGMLYVSFIAGEGTTGQPPLHRFGESAFLSLLRQNGFSVVLRGERAEDSESRISLIARRI